LRRYLEEEAFSQNLVSRQGGLDRALTAYAERDGVIRDAMRRANPWDGMLRLRTLRARLAELFALSIRRRERLAPQGGAGDADPDESYARDYTEGEVELLARVLTAAQKAARRAAADVVFVYLPEWRRYSAPEGADRSREAVLEVASGCGLPVVDIHAVFSRQRDPETLFQFIGEKGGHYNEAGYRLVARTLSAELRSLGLVSSR
jgi:lysophospholipase L1-like esterase